MEGAWPRVEVATSAACPHFRLQNLHLQETHRDGCTVWRQENFAIVVDGLDKDLRLTDGEIVETILCLAVPVLRLLWIRRSLGSNAAATTSHDAGDTHMVLGIVVRKPELLVVAVARDQQIHPQITQGLVEVLLMSAGEVGDDNLPVRLALSHELRDPWLLLRPKRREPAGAGIHGLGAIRCRTRGGGLVVLSTAHVVVGVLLWWHGIDEVGVQEEVVHIEAEVCIDRRTSCSREPA